MTGTVVLIGGGLPARGETAHVERVWTAWLPAPRVAVVPTASWGRPDLTGFVEDLIAYLAGFGVEAFLLPVGTHDDADDPAVLRALDGVGGVYVLGGDTRTLADALRGSALLRRVRALVEGGGVFVGVSAGAILAGVDGVDDQGRNVDGWHLWPGRAWPHADQPDFAFMGARLRGRDHVKLRDGDAGVWRDGELRLLPRPGRHRAGVLVVRAASGPLPDVTQPVSPAERAALEVLLLERHSPYRRGAYYIVPGGGLEAGEVPEAAAVREAHEELSLDVTLVRLAARVHVPDLARTEHYFLATASGEAALHPDSPEAARASARNTYAFRWVPVTALPDLPVFPAALRALDEALARGEVLEAQAEPLS
ncbi:NUDIX domain-containing protein [Deinococcus maricopensis]|uniref:NUDIX hydrolase n=1 Tax=Deinococcus maricopensis (strain DSM 21211 / LMG 22137 / NRRL B-23946 / LB-34) TaxID=709986 RepID=E8U589_DEIML|nr:NUDIX domain-containing protein [Deinococcus maricopensis]ADV66228.1 NUDIX hydrolase [Deinococcus maricopensis DSM 21211]